MTKATSCTENLASYANYSQEVKKGRAENQKLYESYYGNTQLSSALSNFSTYIETTPERMGLMGDWFKDCNKKSPFEFKDAVLKPFSQE